MADVAPPPVEDGIEPGRRLIRVESETGTSLVERITNRLHRLAWRTPLHALRLRGRYPLRLIAVPKDPVAGDEATGYRIREGWFRLGREEIDIAQLDFARLDASPAMADHLQSFAWLRDLAASASAGEAAQIAEFVVKRWLAVHGATVSEAAWRPDLAARRILFWTAYAPSILSSSDIVYRSSVLNGLARFARHLERGADKAPVGLPRVTAWAGVIAAGLLIPGGELRRAAGEEALTAALGHALHRDGGIVSRQPAAQLALVELLAQLAQAYDAVRAEPPEFLRAALARAVPALLGVTLGDGGLSSWQGSRPLARAQVAAVVAGSGVRTRPLRQASEWGYQRLAGGQTVLVLDAAPPPISRLAAGGCASTLAFELSDGPHRIVVNCGAGVDSKLAPGLAEGLRSTAAHSTLVLADSNSTAIHADGSLGRGVAEVELDRQEFEGGSRVDGSHDGYVRRFGFVHRRQIGLSADGREVRGEDVLVPAGRRRRAGESVVAVRFHLGAGVGVTPTADAQGAVLRVPGGAMWQFRANGGTLAVEDSLWVDADGVPQRTHQLLVEAPAPAGGISLAWALRRAG